MTCTPCNGLGLLSEREVCPTCKGTGVDGVLEVPKPKAVKKITKPKKK